MIQVHHIWVDPLWRCSRHRHAARANAFFLINGYLEVHVEKQPGLVDVTHMRPGDMVVVPAGEWHWFETGEAGGAEAHEIYYPTDLSSSDIERSEPARRVELKFTSAAVPTGSERSH